MPVQNISAVTLAVKDMARAVDFYQVKVGRELLNGGIHQLQGGARLLESHSGN